MTARTLTMCLALLLTHAGVSAAQSVRLEFNDGRVNLSAQNAPVRLILAEWTRLGGTRMVNGDRVTGPPLTLELAGVPERQALDIVLRGVAGYMIAAREVVAAGASRFDRIMILPTSAAPRPAPPTSAAATFPQPRVPPAPVPVPFAGDIEPDDDIDFDDPAELPVGVNPRGRVITPGFPPGAVPPAAQGGAFLPPGAGQGGPTVPMPQGGVGVPVGVPPTGGVVIRNGAPPTFVPVPEVTPQPARPGPAAGPFNPFTNLPGSSRPGEIAPVPQQPNRGPVPDER
jgi:hypothetical protein